MIQKTEPFSDPQVELEQYTIDAKCAVDIAYIAGAEFDDIREHFIFDFGTGTGRLSIAFAFFNPYKIVSIDIDCRALRSLRSNALSLNIWDKIEPICAEISKFEPNFGFLKNKINITTIMNPPFGVQRKRADRSFLKKSFFLSDVIYSIHLDNEKVTKFISKFANEHKWRIDFIFPFTMVLERSFWFHTQKKKRIDVNLFRFIKR